MKQLITNKKITLKEAIHKLNKIGSKCLVISDKNKELIGTLSDGDIRRAIVNGYSLDDQIESIINIDPNFFYEERYKKEEAIDLFIKKRFDLIPIVDENLIVKDIIQLNDLIGIAETRFIEDQDTEVIIMAGGIGERLLPLTKDTPKPMMQIGDKPIIQIVLEKFKNYGFKQFTISVNFLSEQIIDHLGDGKNFSVSIDYINESEPLGTAGSLSLKQNLIKGKSYIVTNADVLIDLDYIKLMDFHEDNNADITLCVQYHEVNIPYGVINGNHKLESIQEKPNKTYWINSGLYVLRSSILEQIKAGEYLDMTDLINQQIKKEAKILIYQTFGYWKDIGHKNELEEARNYLSSE